MQIEQEVMELIKVVQVALLVHNHHIITHTVVQEILVVKDMALLVLTHHKMVMLVLAEY